MLKRLGPAAAAVGLLAAARAEVTLTEDLEADATWPEPPAIQTMPPTATTAGERVVSFSKASTVSQTFTPEAPLTLKAIYIAYGAEEGGCFTVRLQEVSDPKAARYEEGPNLFTADLYVAFQPSTSSQRVLKFEFTDEDQVRLLAGKTYAFELIGEEGKSFAWRRKGLSSAYGKGDGYVNRSRVAGGGRDFALAIIGEPAPADQK